MDAVRGTAGTPSITRGSTGTAWVRLEGGRFWAGSEDFYPDEAPARETSVAPFDLAATPVTNRQFAAFIDATGYLTIAERELPVEDFPHLSPVDRAPGSLVFTPTNGPVDLGDWRQWWRWVPGANWRQPGGPGTSFDDKADHPVVQVTYLDALAYAEWAGARLPTEPELEFAACGGRRPDPYAWGSERDLDGRLMANTWRGAFPHANEGAEGWVGTSPVGAFPENPYGFSDSIGNVWEWTTTVYSEAPASHSSCGCSPVVPPGTGGQRVLKGGSHLCAPEYCLRYRPAARSPQAEDSSTTHIGFRIARDAA